MQIRFLTPASQRPPAARAAVFLLACLHLSDLQFLKLDALSFRISGPLNHIHRSPDPPA